MTEHTSNKKQPFDLIFLGIIKHQNMRQQMIIILNSADKPNPRILSSELTSYRAQT